MTKRVLLTGAGGLAASHCLDHLLVHTDWEITCTDSFRHKGLTDRITAVLDGRPDQRHRVTVITHDLAAPVSAQMRRRIGYTDYVLAYAAESHVDRSITDPVPFVSNNVAVALNTLEYARAASPSALVWVSTDEVYGPPDTAAGHREWAPMVPSNPYSASKAAGESLAVSWWRTYQVPVIIVNSVNLIGETQHPEKFLPKTIGHILRGEQVPVHGRAGEIGTRYYLHARNLADAILFLLRRGKVRMFPDARRPDRYNVSGSEPVSNLDMAQQVAGILGRDLSYKLVDFHSARPGHDPHYGLDPGKLTGLGWKPPVDFLSSLERTVRWTASHPEWVLDD